MRAVAALDTHCVTTQTYVRRKQAPDELARKGTRSGSHMLRSESQSLTAKTKTATTPSVTSAARRPARQPPRWAFREGFPIVWLGALTASSLPSAKP